MVHMVQKHKFARLLSFNFVPDLYSATLFCCWGSLGAVGLHLESGTRFSSSAGHVGTVVDTVGAGDTFIAGIILALGVRGYDIGRGLRFACEIASQKCSQYGFKRLLQAIPPDL